MLKAAMTAVVQVFERQYVKYFTMDATDKLRAEVESACAHNIDAEEIMVMFSAAQQQAPNTTLYFLLCRMRAIKNRTVDYLDDMDPSTREDVLQKVITYGRKQRDPRLKLFVVSRLRNKPGMQPNARNWSKSSKSLSAQLLKRCPSVLRTECYWRTL